jgi:protein-disulfide isomerase
MENRQPKEKSKRQLMREQRARQQQRQRLYTVGGIVLAAALIVALFVLPTLRPANSSQEIGEIVQITPMALPEGEGLRLGPPDAPIKIEVFSDFQCPACQDFAQRTEPFVIENLVKAGTASLTYRQFPFIDDRAPYKESDQAANASMCAMEQGRFWDFHDMLFANIHSENQGIVTDARLEGLAQALGGLDMDQWRSCFKANKYLDQINADIKLGESMGVNGTPSVFVNGVIVAPGYVPSYQQVNEAVQAALAETP